MSLVKRHVPAAIFLCLVGTSGCQDDPASTAEPRNSPPIISSVLATPAVVEPGTIVRVEVTAKDPDHDRLAYEFEPTGGTVIEFGPSANWNVPERPGKHSISVTVTDGRGGTARSSANVLVAMETGELNGSLFTWESIELGSAHVRLYDSHTNFVTGSCAYSTLAVATSRSNASFAFTVSPGTYFVWAWKDDDQGGFLDEGDVHSHYGERHSPCAGILGAPTEVRVVAGRTTDISLCLTKVVDGAPIPVSKCP